MDQSILVGPEIEAGKKLIEALDASDFRVKAAFWFYREESEEWRLYIATPLVKEQGPREAYSKVIDSIDLSKISVVDPGEKLVTVLSLAMQRVLASPISASTATASMVCISEPHTSTVWM